MFRVRMNEKAMLEESVLDRLHDHFERPIEMVILKMRRQRMVEEVRWSQPKFRSDADDL